ncbi:MAG: VanZ family protein [Clostridiales bacterium]|nr:VanZ family protein [Clostridiales bacterium]
MRIKMILSIAAAALALGLFAVCIQTAGYPVLLLLFLAVTAFSCNAVRLYGRICPSREKTAVNIWQWAAFVFYLMFLFLLTFGVRRSFPRFILGDPEDLKVYLSNRTNFVPFKTIAAMFTEGNPVRFVMVNIAGNLAATAPLGFFLPLLLRPARKVIPFVLITCLIVIFIEFTQMCFSVGSCDIDDLILNVLGALAAFFVMKIPAVKKRVYGS